MNVRPYPGHNAAFGVKLMQPDSSDTIKVFVVDDHQLFREGLKLMLSDDPAIEVVGESGDGQESIRLIGQINPDVDILDIQMPGLGGLELAPRVKNVSPDTAILMVSMYDNPNYVYQAFKSGCKGYVLKSDSADELKRAIHLAARGKIYLSPGISSDFINHLIEMTNISSGADNLLTSREREICRLVVQGRTTQQLAEDLYISPKTVRVHIANIMKKLACQSRSELIIRLKEMDNI